MSHDSNTKVALLNERFARLLLVAFTSGFAQGQKDNITNLLHNYRGVQGESRYDDVTNALVKSFYLAEVSSVRYDGKGLVFGTYGWYKEVNFYFNPSDGVIGVGKGGVFFSLKVPDSLHESCYMVKELADEILGKSKSFSAVPSRNGHDVKRTYK